MANNFIISLVLTLFRGRTNYTTHTVREWAKKDTYLFAFQANKQTKPKIMRA